MEDESTHWGWWDEIERDAWIRDKCSCVYCGRDGLKSTEAWRIMQTDHLVPRAFFRKNASETAKMQDYWNLVVACIDCNRYKGNYNPSEEKALPSILARQYEATFKRRGLPKKNTHAQFCR